MKIYLLDYNQNICDWWNFYFKDIPDIEIVCENFKKFMDSHKVECIVSPANSYGLMDGGYDLAITKYFGEDLQKKVQKYILDNFLGEQPICTSIQVDINEHQKLIHTPTMRIPSHIKDPLVVYHCMRSALLLAKKNNIQSIVIPAFGGDCGNVNYSILTKMMYDAYTQVMFPPNKLDWEYAYRIRHEEDI